MNSFSEEEKKVIKKLIEGRSFIADLFDFQDFKGFLISYEIDPYTGKNEITILVKNSIEIDEATKKFEELQISIARTLNLVSYLNRNNFVFLIQTSHGISRKALIGTKDEIENFNNNSNAYTFNIPLPENIIKPVLSEYLDKRIIVTKAFQEYYENDFRTKEEIQHNRTYRISVIALITAILIGLISIVLK
jgi:hypothetical protein